MSDRRFTPPKPPSRPEGVSVWRRWKLARGNLFSALKGSLYRAWMAEVRTPIRNAYLANQPSLVKTALVDRPDDFPKAEVIRATLYDLLGDSVFVTNGETWKRQRRMIDPAFEGGRLKDVFPAMLQAADSAVARLSAQAGDVPVEMEFEASHAAADVIFRTLFSVPIEESAAQEVFQSFRRYQRAAPVLSLMDLIGAPRWLPRPGRKIARTEGAKIRALLLKFIEDRASLIETGEAPDDLATKIMLTRDPVDGARFSPQEMLDQVAIFFLAGHETSASALAWALYCLANDQVAQDRVREEARAVFENGDPEFGDIRLLKFTRDVFRETLRLYPPVPMMVRETVKQEHFRNRDIQSGSMFILSPWHLQRHERLWSDPDAFHPDRWSDPAQKEPQRDAFIPFSAGPRVCTGAGFAMLEGVLLLSALVRGHRFTPDERRPPRPTTQLTVRSDTGVWLSVEPLND